MASWEGPGIQTSRSVSGQAWASHFWQAIGKISKQLSVTLMERLFAQITLAFNTPFYPNLGPLIA